MRGAVRGRAARSPRRRPLLHRRAAGRRARVRGPRGAPAAHVPSGRGHPPGTTPRARAVALLVRLLRPGARVGPAPHAHVSAGVGLRRGAALRAVPARPRRARAGAALPLPPVRGEVRGGCGVDAGGPVRFGADPAQLDGVLARDAARRGRRSPGGAGPLAPDRRVPPALGPGQPGPLRRFRRSRRVAGGRARHERRRRRALARVLLFGAGALPPVLARRVVRRAGGRVLRALRRGVGRPQVAG
jgi:hypothetical protein